MKQQNPPRPRAEVEARYRARRREVLERSVRLASAPLARNCAHHYHHAADGVTYCMFGAEQHQGWTGEVCEGATRAPSCPYFRPLRSPLQILEGAALILEDDAFLREAYPDLAELRWVLNRSGEPEDLPWFLRFRAWLRGEAFAARARVMMTPQEVAEEVQEVLSRLGEDLQEDAQP